MKYCCVNKFYLVKHLKHWRAFEANYNKWEESPLIDEEWVLLRKEVVMSSILRELI